MDSRTMYVNFMPPTSSTHSLQAIWKIPWEACPMSMYCCVGHLTWSNGASRSLKVYVYIYIYVCYIVLWKTLLQPNRGSERIRTVCMYMSAALHLLQSLSISVLSCLAALRNYSTCNTFWFTEISPPAPQKTPLIFSPRLFGGIRLSPSPPKNALPGRNKVAGAKDWNQLKVVRAFFFWAWMPLTLYTLSCMHVNIYTYIHIHKNIYIYPNGVHNTTCLWHTNTYDTH